MKASDKKTRCVTSRASRKWKGLTHNSAPAQSKIYADQDPLRRCYNAILDEELIFTMTMAVMRKCQLRRSVERLRTSYQGKGNYKQELRPTHIWGRRDRRRTKPAEKRARTWGEWAKCYLNDSDLKYSIEKWLHNQPNEICNIQWDLVHDWHRGKVRKGAVDLMVLRTRARLYMPTEYINSTTATGFKWRSDIHFLHLWARKSSALLALHHPRLLRGFFSIQNSRAFANLGDIIRSKRRTHISLNRLFPQGKLRSSRWKTSLL